MQPLRRALARCALESGPVRQCTATRASSTWLQGKPPKVDVNAGTMAAFYYRAVREYDLPTKDCIVAVGQDEKMNHGQFDKQVYAYALGLTDALGVRPGDKVALWMSNDLESAVLQYATSLVGAVSVVLDVRLGFPAVKQVLLDESVRVLVAAPRHGSENRSARLTEEFASELGWAQYEHGYQPISSKRFRALKFIVSTGGEAVEGVVRLKDIPVYGSSGEYDMDAVAALQSAVRPSSLASVAYSAGADGSAVKGAPRTHADVLATAAAAARSLALTSSDALTVTAPLSSPLGFGAGVAAAQFVNARTIIPGKDFDAEKTLEAMTLHSSAALVATADQVAALEQALALDAAKPEAKRKFNLKALRGGLVEGNVAAKLGGVTLNKL